MKAEDLLSNKFRIRRPTYNFNLLFDSALSIEEQRRLSKDVSNSRFCTVNNYIHEFGIEPQDSLLLLNEAKINNDGYSLTLLSVLLETELPKSAIEIASDKLGDFQKGITSQYYKLSNDPYLGNSIEEKLSSFVMDVNSLLSYISSGGTSYLKFPTVKEYTENELSKAYGFLMKNYYEAIPEYSELVLSSVFHYLKVRNIYSIFSTCKEKAFLESDLIN